MKVIAVDDEEMMVEYMKRLLWQVEPEAEFVGFTEIEDAFDYLGRQKADIALLDIELGEYSGLELAKRCETLCPNINIIFVTGYNQYALDALQLHASGYLLKPVRAEDLRREFQHLRHPLSSISKRVRIQTFGDFEIFVDNHPLKLPRSKCKECLAYLVDRKGASVTYAKLSSVLWENMPYDRTVQNSTHRVISDLMKALKEVDAEAILIKARKEIAIDTEKVDCDYYAAISGDRTQMNAFTGEYMSNYSWAEFTLGELLRIRTK